jgi:uncharacterized 2Fe-2S/4Fe-4S cluster protein (DUF4445 family)
LKEEAIDLIVCVKKADTKTSLLRSIEESGVRIRSVCGGLGICGKCVVRVLRGREILSSPTDAENRWLGEKLEEGFRLACQTRMLREGEVEVWIPPESRETREALLLPSLPIQVEIRPRFRRKVIQRGNDVFTQVLRGEQVVAEEEGLREILGVALDVGTTNLVGYLLDLETGKILSTEAIPNPQLGEDLMTRLSLHLQGADLRTPLISGINELLDRLGRRKEVYEMVVTGNSVMHHFFFNLPLESLAKAPFSPFTLLSLERKGREVGVDFPGWIYSPPLVGGFVGSDCVADVLASRLWREKEPWLLVDVGTNTEIVLSNGERMWACSCASGPAFEGGRLTCGRRAGKGAIWGVKLDESLRPVLQVEGTPTGICGSGAVDLLAELVRTGAVSRDGRMIGEGERFREGRQGREFVVHEEVVLTQSDVRELQLAKAAIAAGIRVLMELAGLEFEDFSRLAIAGAFGVSLNVDSAVSIGMLPPVGQILKLGHGAGLGAQLMLLSNKERETAEKIAREIEHVSLAGKEEFQRWFVESMRLEPLA